MPLVKNGAVVADAYAMLADDAPVPEQGAIIVSAVRLLAEGETICARRAPVGVLWPNNRDVGELAPFLDRLALIALVFPKFRDGRAYTQARMLRERYGYRGEMRATGQVLRDQFLFMQRAGFDSFDVIKEADADNFARAVARYSVFYQPASDGRTSAFRARLLSSAPAGQSVAKV